MSANPGAKTDGGLLFRKRSPPQMRGNLQSQNGPCMTKAGARVNGVAKSAMGQFAGGQAGLSAERSDVSQVQSPNHTGLPNQAGKIPCPWGRGKVLGFLQKWSKCHALKFRKSLKGLVGCFFPWLFLKLNQSTRPTALCTFLCLLAHTLEKRGGLRPQNYPHKTLICKKQRRRQKIWFFEKRCFAATFAACSPRF